MFNRKTIIALAAVASLGAVALATNDASARAFGGGMRMGGGYRGSLHVVGGPRLGGVRRIGPIIGRRPIGRIFGHRPIRQPIFVLHHHRHHPRWWWWGWRRHYWLPPVVATGVATGVAAAPTWNRCNCLTKEYTPEGAVVFKDLCTQESAMNPSAQASAIDPSQDPAVPESALPQVQAQVQPQAVTPQTAVPPAR